MIRTRERDALQKYLNEHGISTAIHYPVVLPFMQAYDYLGHKAKDFSVAYQYQNEILSLPIYLELSNTSISYVANKIKEHYIQ